jgi:dTMP kinase
MGRLIVVEGLDGSGKRTLTEALTRELTARDARVATFAFPRYDIDPHADLVREGLYGRLAAVNASVEAMSLLYALDRRAAAVEIGLALEERDVVLVDRFTASNAAFGAGRLGQDAAGPFVAWVAALEAELGVPVPDHQVLLSVPANVAGARAARREQEESGRERDTYEADGGLQERTGEVYAGLAAAGWLSPWTVVDGSTIPDASALVERMGC